MIGLAGRRVFLAETLAREGRLAFDRPAVGIPSPLYLGTEYREGNIMVATAVAIIHEQNFKAERELQIVGQPNGIVHINIDGVCALRVKMVSGAKLDINVEDMYRIIGVLR